MKINKITNLNQNNFEHKPDISNRKIYLLTNSDNFGNDTSFLNAIEESVLGGVDLIQFREKEMSDELMITLGKKVKNLCEKYKIPFIVNDRIKIAEILHADGVHLGQGDDSIQLARKALGNDALIGISAPNKKAAQKAQKEGADYIGIGPVFKTPLKDEPTVKMSYLRWVAKNFKLPAFAIGGINMSNIDEVLKTGIKRFCFIRTIINANSPRQAAETYLNKLI